MHLLITGICGFVGSVLARELITHGHQVSGIDNLIRPGSHTNSARLRQLGASISHGDIRNASDLETLPQVDFVIDAAANASVLAGVDGKASSRQLVEHNLGGTINLLEYCRCHQAGFILLSTSRVYSIPPLAGLPVTANSESGAPRFTPDPAHAFPHGLSGNGVSETFSTAAPVSLYGSTKLASEQLALEYGFAYEFPVWINRCGVMAGAGQFGQPAQGIFAFWIHSFREGRQLKYIGFGGTGAQVRDCLHPRDLVPLLEKQVREPLDSPKARVLNSAGGLDNSMSLAELSAWCQQRFPSSSTTVTQTDTQRPFDIPWMVLDSSRAKTEWGWHPTTSVTQVCADIAQFAENEPAWLALSA